MKLAKHLFTLLTSLASFTVFCQTAPPKIVAGIPGHGMVPGYGNVFIEYMKKYL